MTMSHSGALAYGVDLGFREEAEWSWFTEELEEEHGGPAEVLDHLLKDVKKVGHDQYGNFSTGYTGLFLCTQYACAAGWAPERVGIDRLSGTVGDDELLRQAWAILDPNTLMPDPGWHLVTKYS